MTDLQPLSCGGLSASHLEITLVMRSVARTIEQQAEHQQPDDDQPEKETQTDGRL